jgi:hypothetical protein
VEEYLGKASLQHAEPVSTTLMSTLWRPTGNVQLSWLARGRFFDGWLSSKSSITVWPDSSGKVSGTLKLSLYLSAHSNATSVRLVAPGFKRTVHVSPGSRIPVNVPVHSSSAWTLDLTAPGLRFLPDGRTVSVQSLPPVFERTPALKPTANSADRG